MDIYKEGDQIDYIQLMDWAIIKFKSRNKAGPGARRQQKKKT
jgi:hypothetical protein